jgi:hypothetical protein
MNWMMIVFITMGMIFLTANCRNLKCSIDDAIRSFRDKLILEDWPEFEENPYHNQTESSRKMINDTLHDKDMVCAIQYSDKSKNHYQLKTFSNKTEAESKEYIVTHQGPCGACSTLQDLSVFLSTDLTITGRFCGTLTAISNEYTASCFSGLGMSRQCAEIWLFNTLNTRKDCALICAKAWIKGENYTNPDGSLSECLQCDEDNSGPVFKYYSGRTRRNSGIHSEIDRPSDSIYNITHCYY